MAMRGTPCFAIQWLLTGEDWGGLIEQPAGEVGIASRDQPSKLYHIREVTIGLKQPQHEKEREWRDLEQYLIKSNMYTATSRYRPYEKRPYSSHTLPSHPLKATRSS